MEADGMSFVENERSTIAIAEAEKSDSALLVDNNVKEEHSGSGAASENSDSVSPVDSQTPQVRVTVCDALVTKSERRSLPDGSSYQQHVDLLKKSFGCIEVGDAGSTVAALQQLAWVAFLGDDQSFSEEEAQAALKRDNRILIAWECLRPVLMNHMLLTILSCRAEGGSLQYHFATWTMQAFLCAGYLAMRMSDKVPGLSLADLLFDDKWCDILAFRFAHDAPQISLNLVGRCTGAYMVQRLSSFLPGARCIVQLDLSCNQMGPEDVKELVDSLGSHGTLRWLLLGSNLFGNEGAAYVAQYLAADSSLKGMSLRSCRIREKGATAIAQALSQGTSLEHLCLASNRIGDWGAEELAMTLPGTKLRSLDLSNCSISSRAALQLSKGISLAPTLQSVNLDGNDVSEPGADHLVASMGGHRELRHLSLAYKDALGKVQQNVLRSGHLNGLELIAERPAQPGSKSSRIKQHHSSLRSEQRPSSVQGVRSSGLVTKLTFCRPATRHEAWVSEAAMLAQVTAEETAWNEASAQAAQTAARLKEAEEREAQTRFRKAADKKKKDQVADVHKKQEVAPWVKQLSHLDNVWSPGGGGNPLNIMWSYRLNSLDKTVSEDLQSGNDNLTGEPTNVKTRCHAVQNALNGMYDGFCVKMDLRETLNRTQGQAEAEAKVYWEAHLRKQRDLTERRAAASKLAIAGRVATPRRRQPTPTPH
eukprot:gnl/MRDRNA2_/MRDRNA2_106696_c0_seq1.p1 gnl/MRDRNA2_/MRDRNA2_106696_c0~~gnl/MRDRNA2_/MRDRNA2_106696_c0_seq1.p1  ORF type:complete len:726 (+),score=140.61 gnl/MRDRNA2_/MRDRNA2_106696_c0_seq1:64-2178(+)